MKDVIKILEGKKSYIVAGIFVLINVLQFFNIIHLDPKVLETIDLILGGIFGLTMKAGFNRVLKDLGIKLPEKK